MTGDTGSNEAVEHVESAETAHESDSGLNIEEASSNIARDLFGTKEESEDEAPDTLDVEESVKEPKEPEPVRPAPKSWSKEQHDRWAKLDKDTQDYIELREKQALDGITQYKAEADRAKKFHETVAPFQEYLKSNGVDEYTAVRNLLHAQYLLTNGTTEERRAAYQRLGQNLGLLEDQNTQVDPTISALQAQVAQLGQVVTANQRRAYNEAHTQVSKEVEKFASDPSHPYFDELSDDIASFITNGASLQDAYDKAVWANPSTRQKEIARLQTEEKEKLKIKAKEEAEKARKATGANIRSRETRSAPTSTKGRTIEETMKETMREIRARQT